MPQHHAGLRHMWFAQNSLPVVDPLFQGIS
jgi:hypothetical protein